jgi:perosamine synthetase
MNVNNIESIVSQNTKIVLPVHIYGLPVDMQPIWELRKSHNFIILEDSAEALGVTCYGQKSGALGDVSIFSLYANKLITAGEGGMIATSDNILAEKLRGLRNLNFSKAERFVNFELGYAARLNNLGATLALSQLREIDQLLEIKSFLAKRYLEGLDGHPWFDFQATSTSYAENKYWVFGLVLKDSVPFSAKVFQGLLLSHGIESRRFFCPLHLQPVARKFDVVLDPRGMTNSELLWERGLYLPFGTGIRIDEVDEVIRVLWHILTRPH